MHPVAQAQRGLQLETALLDRPAEHVVCGTTRSRKPQSSRTEHSILDASWGHSTGADTTAA